jgi:acyl-CoA thioesterase FadM
LILAARGDLWQRRRRFEEVLHIAVRLANIGRKSVTYAFEFSVEGEVVARGRVSSVCCRVLPDHRLESVELLATLRARLEQMTPID